MSKKRVTKKTTVKPTKSVLSNTQQASDVAKARTDRPQSTQDLLFGKQNYIYILGGLGLMILGFILMSGGSMPDANTWDDSIIYSTRRTLIAPIFILAGLVVQVLAIFKKSN